MNQDKIILHLCATEGSDSKPYRDAGYDVRIIGEDIGVENYTPPPNVHGIIANPPCTMFSVARTKAKTPRNLQEGMRLVRECLRIIWECQYRLPEGKASSPLQFWSLENPATGMLRWFLGDPKFEYSQDEYGADYPKKTALWGYFNLPKRPILTMSPKQNYGDTWKHGWSKMQERSRCPIDFAMAFFEANP